MQKIDEQQCRLEREEIFRNSWNSTDLWNSHGLVGRAFRFQSTDQIFDRFFQEWKIAYAYYCQFTGKPLPDDLEAVFREGFAHGVSEVEYGVSVWHVGEQRVMWRNFLFQHQGRKLLVKVDTKSKRVTDLHEYLGSEQYWVSYDPDQPLEPIEYYTVDWATGIEKKFDAKTHELLATNQFSTDGFPEEVLQQIEDCPVVNHISDVYGWSDKSYGRILELVEFHNG